MIFGRFEQYEKKFTKNCIMVHILIGTLKFESILGSNIGQVKFDCF